MSLIEATFTLPGLHRWPGAPERRAYLRSLHRHLFAVTVTVATRHDDRDVEFHDLGEEARALLAARGEQYHPQAALLTFGASSCEMLAEDLASELAGRGYDVTRVAVSEDGENTGIWERTLS